LGMQIDQDDRRHSHLYELKPMSRWWLVVGLALSVLGVYVNGWDNPATWYLLMVGWGLGLATLLTNPRKWLSKLD
jgi:hypothetical protein